MVGTDIVDIERLRDVFARCPQLERRLFTSEEVAYCRKKADPVRSFAGTLAAKEAVMKAAGLGGLPAWARRIEIERSPMGVPRASLAASPAAAFHVSISHDGGAAIAIAMRVK